MKVKSESQVAQSCPTLRDPMDCSLPGSLSIGFSGQEYWNGVPLPSPESSSVVSNSLRPHGLYSSWNSPGQNNGVGSLSFSQGIFPTQRSNPGLPHCRQILYQLNHREALVAKAIDTKVKVKERDAVRSKIWSSPLPLHRDCGGKWRYVTTGEALRFGEHASIYLAATDVKTTVFYPNMQILSRPCRSGGILLGMGNKPDKQSLRRGEKTSNFLRASFFWALTWSCLDMLEVLCEGTPG